MLIRRNPPLPTVQRVAHPDYAQLAPEIMAVLARLADARIDYVLVGAVAESILTRRPGSGPVKIVPAPYRRNLERLTRERDAMAESGLSLETQLEQSGQYQEILYEARGHLIAEGVRVEVAGRADLGLAGEIRASRGSAAVDGPAPRPVSQPA